MNPMTPDTEELFAVLPFTVEDDFSYFCKYDELTSVIAVNDNGYLAIDPTSYINRSKGLDQLRL